MYLRNRLVVGHVREAVQGAAIRLRRPRCAALFDEYRDGQGFPLSRRLGALGFTAEEYLHIVVFTDGHLCRRCRDRGVAAVTGVGSRVVFVCRDFAFQHARKPSRGEALIIHEALHTLGLQEDPPLGDRITERVVESCWGQ